MAFLSDNVFDSGLNYIVSKADRIDLCSQEPQTYTEATATYSLGNKTSGVNVNNPTDRSGGGREVLVDPVLNGTITSSGTATHWAITDGQFELIATGSLSSSQAVTNNSLFNTDSFTIGIPTP